MLLNYLMQINIDKIVWKITLDFDLSSDQSNEEQ